LGLSGPVPARVPAAVKELVLKTVDDAVAAGFAHTWACSLWRLSDSRVHRWRARCRDTGTLVDRAPAFGDVEDRRDLLGQQRLDYHRNSTTKPTGKTPITLGNFTRHLCG
jgi:hypothetical protein